MLGAVDRVDFVEPVRQVRRVAHVVDRLPYRPIRRHGDEIGLHPPAGGILRVFEAPFERIALRRRQLVQDLFLVFLIERLEQFDGIIGVQLAHAFRDGLRLKLFEDLLADGIVDFVERRKMEIGAGQFHQPDAIVGVQRRDQIAEIGLMEFGYHGAQKRRVVSFDCTRHLIDEFAADLAVLPAHRDAVEHRVAGNVHLFGHGAPRRFDRMIQLV